MPRDVVYTLGAGNYFLLMAMKLNTLDSIESEILRTERDLP